MKRRILLVDDEVAVLLTLKAVLEISGFEVDTAASAKEGRSKLHTHEYQMVITDMRMESEASGLEVIEAARLFSLAETAIDVLVHRQSVIHGMVCYQDGSVLAQLGSPDMRIPIAHTLAWPERIRTASPRLDLAAVARLDFEAPDPVRFPALRVAREVLRAGGGAPAILSAANEVAVEAFLARRIGFLDIVATVEAVLGRMGAPPADTLEDVVALDAAARIMATELVASRARHDMVAAS